MAVSNTPRIYAQQTIEDVSNLETLNGDQKAITSKCAKRIVKDVLNLKQGENLTIETWEHELPFAKEVVFAARKAGANVLLVVEAEENYFRLIEEGSEKSLGHVGTHEWSLLENSDAYVFFPGPADIQRQSKLNEKKRSGSTAYNQEWYKRARKARLRGVRVRTSYATSSRAEMMGLDLQKWRKNLHSAIDVDYQSIDRLAKKLSKIILKGNVIRIQAPEGTDLVMKTSRIPPHIYSGVMGKSPDYNIYSSMMTIPGSELDIVPRAGSANGTVFFDRPVYSGSERVEGLSWTIKNGRLIHYEADQNLDVFAGPFKKATGDKDKIGALIIGLTPNLSYGFGTSDLNVLGAISVGVGSFLEGDKNKTSYQAYGTISRATLSVDDRVLINQGSLAN